MSAKLSQKIASFLSTAARAAEAQVDIDSHSTDSAADENSQVISASDKLKITQPTLSERMEQFMRSIEALNNSSSKDTKERAVEISGATWKDLEAFEFLKNATEFFVVSNPKPSLDKDPKFLLDGSKYIFIEKETKSFQPENGTAPSPQTSFVLRATSPKGFNIVRFVTQGRNLLELEAKSKNSSAETLQNSENRNPSASRPHLVVQSVEVVTSRSQKVGPVENFDEDLTEVPKQQLNSIKGKNVFNSKFHSPLDHEMRTITTESPFVTDETFEGTTTAVFTNEELNSFLSTGDGNIDIAVTQTETSSSASDASPTSTESNGGNTLKPFEANTEASIKAPKSLDREIVMQIEPAFSFTTAAPSHARLQDTLKNPSAKLHVENVRADANSRPHLIAFKTSHELGFHSSELESDDFYSQELFDIDQNQSPVDFFDDDSVADPLEDSIEIIDDDDAGSYFRKKGKTISDLVRSQERARNPENFHGDKGFQDPSRERGRTSASVLLLLLTSLTRAMHDNGSNSRTSVASPTTTTFPNHFKHFNEVLSETHSFLNKSKDHLPNFLDIPPITTQVDSPITTVFKEPPSQALPIPKSLLKNPLPSLQKVKTFEVNTTPPFNEANFGTGLSSKSPNSLIPEALPAESFQSLSSPSEILPPQLQENIFSETPSFSQEPLTNFPSAMTLNPHFSHKMGTNTPMSSILPFFSDSKSEPIRPLLRPISQLIDTLHPSNTDHLVNDSSFQNTLIETTTQMDTFLGSTQPAWESSKTDFLTVEGEDGFTTELNLQQLLPNRDNPLESGNSFTDPFRSENVVSGFGPETAFMTTTIPTPATPSQPLKLQISKAAQSSSKSTQLGPRRKFHTPKPMEKLLTKNSLAVGKHGSPMTPTETLTVTREQELSPEGTVLCRPSTKPDCAPEGVDFCLQDPHYPRNEVIKALSSNARLASYFANSSLSGPRGSFSLVSGISRQRDLSFTYSYHNPGLYDVTHWLGSEGYACPSSVSYARPMRARNTRGQWRVVVQNVRGVHQRTRTEVCLYPGHPCRLVAPRYGSRCVQKYALTQLLVTDPCDISSRLFVDTFRLPSACSCFAHAYG